MTRVDRHHYDMLVRVKQFGVAHADLFPADTLGARTFAALGTAVDQVSGSLTSEVQGRTSARSGSHSKAAAREALRAALETLARTAKPIAAGVPGLERKFRLLSSAMHDLELLSVARAFILDAAPLAPQLAEHGLSLADLQAALDAFETAGRDGAAARETRVTARAGIVAAVAAADEALARLDALVPNLLRGHPTLLAAWRVARHVRRRAAGGNGQPAPAPDEPIAPAAVIPVAAPSMADGLLVPPPIPQV